MAFAVSVLPSKRTVFVFLMSFHATAPAPPKYSPPMLAPSPAEAMMV